MASEAPDDKTDPVEYTGPLRLEDAQRIAAAHLIAADMRGYKVERRAFLTSLAAGLFPEIFGRKPGGGNV